MFRFELKDPPPLYVDLPVKKEPVILCEQGSIPLQISDSTLFYTWSRNGQYLAAGPEYTLSREGSYEVMASSKEGCTVNQSFTVVLGDDLFVPNFLIPSEVNAGDPIALIETSWPVPDSIMWAFDTSAIQITDGFLNQITLTFSKPGKYEIKLTGWRNGCISTIRKQVSVYEVIPGASIPLWSYSNILDFKISPNPNTGKFLTEVTLKNPADIQLRLYNQTGHLLSSAQERGRTGYNIAFDQGNIGPGIYTMLLSTETEHRYRSFIVQN